MGGEEDALTPSSQGSRAVSEPQFFPVEAAYPSFLLPGPTLPPEPRGLLLF